MKNILEHLYRNYLDKPNNIAFVDSEKEITYNDLFLDVLDKATHLVDLGYNREPIIVKVNRKIETIVSFFAILLSGNYYIPVDEDIPNYKLEQIIRISGCKSFISFKEENLGIDRIIFQKTDNCRDFSWFMLDFDESNYAYLMFTSGSTGEPKGVIKNHKNLISFVDNFVGTFDFLKEERIANQAPFFFDASAKDIYLTLKLGGTLFIPDKSVFSLPMESINYLNENKISLIYWVPSILSMIAKTRTLNFIKPKYLKYVFFVGEVFMPKYLNMWLEALPEIRYFNTYGSTEVSGVSLYYEITKPIEGDRIPTGIPIKNNAVFLEKGEIVIDSDQVAVGYVNGSANKAFVTKNGRQVLHTGDYGKYEDGNIVFVSRKDFQIKHLGYRIELQEIEAAINDFNYVDQCCAIYQEEKDLIYLFVCLNQEIDNPVKKILGDAKEKLQFYMVPNKVVVIDEMPLNKNSKIDRVALKRKVM